MSDIDKLREQTVEVASTSRSASLEEPDLNTLSSEARNMADSTKTFLSEVADKYTANVEPSRESAFEKFGPL